MSLNYMRFVDQLHSGFLGLILLVAMTLSVVGCRNNKTSPAKDLESERRPWFAEVSPEWNVQFRHVTDAQGEYFMPESIGSGVAIFDFDNDGLLDIYFMNNVSPTFPEADRARNQLYRQSAPGHFVNVSAGSGLDVTGRFMGVAAGDLNNDGWNDVFVTEYGKVRLFMNQKNGTFVDVSESAGIINDKWGTSACFFDFDRDGWLDIAVANYVEYEETQKCYDGSGQREYCGPSGFPPSVSRLFRNLGKELSRGGTLDPNSVRFEDVTLPSGIARRPGPGLGVIAADFSGDGWPDLFFADDAEANRLFINQQNGTFEEEALQRGIAFNAMGQSQADMGVAVADVDGNGHLDVFVTHLNTESHSLWIQDPPGYFRDAASSIGISKTKWRGTGFGTVFGDFDQDGFIDLAIANGGIKRDRSVESEAESFWGPYGQCNQILRNNARNQFVDRSEIEKDFCNSRDVSRGLAVADLNNDGGLDLVVTNISGSAKIFDNVAPRQHWLLIRAVDDECGGRDAYGAIVSVRVNDTKISRLLNPGYSFLCSNDVRCHFGLGAARQFDSIEVIWPSGEIERFQGDHADQLITLRKGTGQQLNSTTR